MTQSSKKDTPFNSSAASYDSDFTQSTIGIAQRSRVYYWLNQIDFFSSPKNIFEINCGTGYDAEEFHKKGHQVTATDQSSSMISFAQQNRNEKIIFKTQSFQDVIQSNSLTHYDSLFSNFGGLNCIDSNSLADFLSKVATLQKKGDELILVLMAKQCFMESLYFLFRFKFSKIRRRNTQKGLAVTVKDEKVLTYYYAPKELIHLLKETYDITLVEVLLSKFNFMAKWSDHYIIAAKKR